MKKGDLLYKLCFVLLDDGRVDFLLGDDYKAMLRGGKKACGGGYWLVGDALYLYGSIPELGAPEWRKFDEVSLSNFWNDGDQIWWMPDGPDGEKVELARIVNVVFR